MASRPDRRSHCPTAFALDVFGDRWTLLIVRDLMFKGRRHFREFVEAGEGISTNILADRLARLEANGIVAASGVPEDGRSKRYRLTPRGIDLVPLMVEMIAWSGRHDPETDASPAFLKRAKHDREALVAEIVAGLVRASHD